MIQALLPFESVAEIFERVFRELKPRTEAPRFEIRFYPYVNLDSTIRLDPDRRGVRVKLSDQLEQAPAGVLEALANILLAKLYRKPVAESHDRLYRRFVHRRDVRERAHEIRRRRGRKRCLPPQGRVYDLDEMFDRLNRRYFEGKLDKPGLGWSLRPSRRLLGHYDAAHHTIVLSRVLDAERAPRYAAEYVLYHEMLHVKHPAEYRNERRCVHTREFKEEERRFPRYKEAVRYINKL